MRINMHKSFNFYFKSILKIKKKLEDKMFNLNVKKIKITFSILKC